jgi:hypothetical protein
MQQSQAGQPAPKHRRMYDQLNKGITALVNGYVQCDHIVYLRGIAHSLEIVV